MIAGLLLAPPNNYSGRLHAPAAPAPPRALRRAVELIGDEPGRPWTSSTLAREVSVSVRALQEGFQRWFGLPPMAYLRDVRLTRVHDELTVADPDSTTIATVAARWGFLHAGRFSTADRRKFGVLPSETLHGRHPMKGPTADSRRQVGAGDPATVLAARWPDSGAGQGLRTTFSQLSCFFLNISKPRSASSSGRVWVMIRVGSSSPRSMRSSSGFM